MDTKGQPQVRYSDEELEEFRVLIEEKLEQARKDLARYQEAVRASTDETAPTFKQLEEGYNVMSKENNATLASRQEKFIKGLENALIRINNKTYGICRITGKLIPKERLRAVPHATTSVEGKNMEKK